MPSNGEVPKPRIVMFVDQPSIHAMERHRQVGVTPKRLFELGSDLGDLIYWTVFVDRRISDDESNKWDQAGFEVIYCPRVKVKSRLEVAGAPRPSSEIKETIDLRLIERIHRTVKLLSPDQVFMVVGDSDYIPVIRSLIYEDHVGVRLFLTAECKLLKLDYGSLLLGRHLLFEDREMTYPRTDMAAFKTIPTTKELHRVAPEMMSELFLHADQYVMCTSCEEPVLIGMLKLHKCHPNPLLHLVECPICRAEVPFEDWKAHPCLKADRVPNGDAAKASVGGKNEGTPTGKPKSIPAPLPKLTIDTARLEELRASAVQLDESPDINHLVGALRKAISPVALAWLIQKKRKGKLDTPAALTRALKNSQDALIAHWVNALQRIRDELSGQYPAAEVKKLISSWMEADVSWEAIALLIQEDVLKTDGQGSVQRGSLMHPVYQLLRTISQFPANA